MDLRTYVAVVKKYLPLILVGTFLGGLVGYGVYRSEPKQYAASVQFYVSTPVPENGSAQSSGQFAAGRMASYTELLSSQELGERVAKATGLAMAGDQIAKEIVGDTTVDSVLLKATVTDTDGTRALRIAEGVAKVFGPMVDQLDNQGRKVPVVQINTVSAPRLHPAPVAPQGKMTVLLGLAAGLALTVLIALLRELLDTSIRTAQEAHEVAGAPVIGSIPSDASAKRTPLLLAERGSSPRAEAHRQLRTNLNFLDAAQTARVVVFTSAADGDGTSTVAANTAISFAESGERVCLLQADLRHPDGLDAFGVGGRTGLSELLSGRGSLDEVIQHVPTVQGLDVVAAGDLPPNPAELLSSPRLAEVVATLRGNYDRVIVDAPAAIDTADASIVAAVSDGVVLVLRNGRTGAQDVEQARAQLGNVRSRLLGVVMNRVRTSARPFGRN